MKRFMNNMQRDQPFLEIDFINAFGTLLGDAILGATSPISSRSHFQFDEFVLLSEEAARQVNPLRPLYFCLVFKERLEFLESQVVLLYMDDVTAAIALKALIIVKNFILVEKTAEHLRLEVNHTKCGVVGHTNKTRRTFNSQKNTFIVGRLYRIVKVSWAASRLVLAAKKEQLQRLTRRLELMSSHDCFSSCTTG